MTHPVNAIQLYGMPVEEKTNLFEYLPDELIKVIFARNSAAPHQSDLMLVNKKFNQLSQELLNQEVRDIFYLAGERFEFSTWRDCFNQQRIVINKLKALSAADLKILLETKIPKVMTYSASALLEIAKIYYQLKENPQMQFLEQQKLYICLFKILVELNHYDLAWDLLSSLQYLKKAYLYYFVKNIQNSDIDFVINEIKNSINPTRDKLIDFISLAKTPKIKEILKSVQENKSGVDVEVIVASSQRSIQNPSNLVTLSVHIAARVSSLFSTLFYFETLDKFVDWNFGDLNDLKDDISFINEFFVDQDLKDAIFFRMCFKGIKNPPVKYIKNLDLRDQAIAQYLKELNTEPNWIELMHLAHDSSLKELILFHFLKSHRDLSHLKQLKLIDVAIDSAKRYLTSDENWIIYKQSDRYFYQHVFANKAFQSELGNMNMTLEQYQAVLGPYGHVAFSNSYQAVKLSDLSLENMSIHEVDSNLRNQGQWLVRYEQRKCILSVRSGPDKITHFAFASAHTRMMQGIIATGFSLTFEKAYHDPLREKILLSLLQNLTYNDFTKNKSILKSLIFSNENLRLISLFNDLNFQYSKVIEFSVGEMDRNHVEKLLKCQPNGTWMVRFSEKQKKNVLSMRKSDKILHGFIDNNDEKIKEVQLRLNCTIDPDKQYKSI